MEIYKIFWIIIQILLSIWVFLETPSKSILRKYPFGGLFLSLFNPSGLARIEMSKKDSNTIRKFFFRFRLWCVFTIVSLLLFNLIAIYRSNELLIELTR